MKEVFNVIMIMSEQTPFTLPVLFMGLFMVTLDTRNLMMMALVFFNMLVNSILKVIIKEGYKYTGKESWPILGRGYRPNNNKNCSVFGGKVKGEQTFGMPSGHSQIIWSVIGYLLVQLYHDNKYDANFKYFYPFQVMFLVFLGMTVSYSRVHIKCHTPMQVIMGGIVGLGIGIGWYYMYPHPPILE